MKSKLFTGLSVFLVLLIVIAGLLWWYFLAGRVDVPSNGDGEGESVLALAQHLEIPWALDFLPDGSIVFTERPGRIRIVSPSGELNAEPLLTIPEVAHDGEGGLLGIAVHPDFNTSGYIYVYYTYRSGGRLTNKVVRLLYNGGELVPDKVIIDGIPGASNHNGGRIKFGPDGMLYITTGDASNAQLAQDIGSLAGKILRLDDGTIPSDNPFPGSPVYSYGHRNPQGLAWDSDGRLWATEHGQSATDELNLIVAGQNYGWPVIRGNETAPGMKNPVVHSGSITWAPSGMAFLDGYLYFAGLRGQSIFWVDISNPAELPARLFDGDFGRVRDIVVGLDGYLYIITSNRDGRAIPSGVDDQLIRIDPDQLQDAS